MIQLVIMVCIYFHSLLISLAQLSRCVVYYHGKKFRLSEYSTFLWLLINEFPQVGVAFIRST